MDKVTLACLNRLAEALDVCEHTEEAVKATDAVYVFYDNTEIILDKEVLDFAREYYKRKLETLKTEFDNA